MTRIKIIMIAVLSLMNLSLCRNPNRIAFIDGNNIKIVSLSGEIIDNIKLKTSIVEFFLIKNSNKIWFYGLTEGNKKNIFIYDLSEKKEEKAVELPNITSYSFLPDVSKVIMIFERKKKIFIYDLLNMNEHQISLPREMENFSFSNDGTRLAYDEPTANGKRDIYIYDLIEKREEKITSGPYIFKKFVYKEKDLYGEERYFSPKISPDGKYVAFEYTPEFNFGLMEFDEKDISPPYEFGKLALMKKEGNKILVYDRYYNKDLDALEETRELGLIEISNKKFFPITKDSEYINKDPIWSHDSKKIAFLLEAGYVGIFDLETKRLREQKEKILGWPIEWQNNNMILYFFNNDRPIYKLLDLSTQKEISFPYNENMDKAFFEDISQPNFSFDKKYIVFSKPKDKDSKEWNIFLINMEKKEIKKIAEARTEFPNPIFLDY